MALSDAVAIAAEEFRVVRLRSVLCRSVAIVLMLDNADCARDSLVWTSDTLVCHAPVALICGCSPIAVEVSSPSPAKLSATIPELVSVVKASFCALRTSMLRSKVGVVPKLVLMVADIA